MYMNEEASGSAWAENDGCYTPKRHAFSMTLVELSGGKRPKRPKMHSKIEQCTRMMGSFHLLFFLFGTL